MSDDVVIRAERLGKSYLIGHAAGRDRYGSLRDTLAGGARSLWRKAGSIARGRPLIVGATTEAFWALRDVNFEVKRGEVLGIIGRNGAGKSTLLKILSRIVEPTQGRVEIHGRVSSLLEVGTGFHPELTGRENIYLNGAILGMTRAEIRRKFDEIVDFSGVEKFLDTPVKRYSSGMYVRLAFAVAAHLEPEILIVDEVLAVGDAQFQRKCINQMRNLEREQRTVLFVSHNLAAVKSLCTKATVLDKGCVLVPSGDVDVALQAYAELQESAVNIALEDRLDRQGSGRAFFKSIRWFRDAKPRITNAVSGRPLTLELTLGKRVQESLKDVAIYVGISGVAGSVLTVLMSETTAKFSIDNESTKIQCSLPCLQLSEGKYSINLMLRAGGEIEDWIEESAVMDVEYGVYYRNGSRPPLSHQSVLLDQVWGLA